MKVIFNCLLKMTFNKRVACLTRFRLSIPSVDVSGPNSELAHEHRELSGLLLAMHEALGRVERGESQVEDELHELRDGIEAFREALLEHVAREQEGVLPWLTTRLPDVHARVEALVEEHDRISALLDTLVKELGAVEGGGAIGEWSASLARFDLLYAHHSRSEAVFFAEVASTLAGDQGAASELRDLLNER